MSQSQDGQSSQSSTSSRFANYSEVDRAIIVHYAGVAKERCGEGDTDINLPLSSAVNIMVRKLVAPIIGRTPQEATINAIWASLLSTGKVGKVQGGGRKKPTTRALTEPFVEFFRYLGHKVPDESTLRKQLPKIHQSNSSISEKK